MASKRPERATPKATPKAGPVPTTSRARAKPSKRTAKDVALDEFRERPEGTTLTTDQGIAIPQTDDSLRAGPRGPTIMEDFHFREKITRFDHERIPERVVHARGSAAHGYFEPYPAAAKLCRAGFLQDPGERTPVFVRFSTVAGSRGSADTVRDVRGFAVKFYTREGNFDLVGNNIPVFFIQDGIKFPDFIHAVKPEPHNEIPQAASAHDTFWDFVGLQPETMHMVMWVMSDRALPRSLAMMEGFGVHTFRLIDAAGRAKLVKFHWKPKAGIHSLLWDEAQKINGKDPDFHRRDLWDSIEAGNFPEWELGVQVIDEKDELRYGFDMLDATKLLPEELVPVTKIGRMVLDRNPDNFFAETEQVAFHVGNVVPGIDFTNDPLMQARLFSYVDTQLTRLGGPNFAELPINRPLAPVHNHQSDGFGRQTVPTGRALYHPNSVGGGCPFLASGGAGFVHHAEKVEGYKIRERSPSFADHYSQARLFLNSQTPVERKHLTEACQFELGKVERKEIRERVLGHFAQIDDAFAREVASKIGVAVPKASAAPKGAVPKPKGAKTELQTSPALSMIKGPDASIRGRKIAVLAADGFSDFAAAVDAFTADGAVVHVVAPVLGMIEGDDGEQLEAPKSLLHAASVEYDAVMVAGGDASADALVGNAEAVHFVREAFKHCKTIGALGNGALLLKAAGVIGEPKKGKPAAGAGVIVGDEGKLGPFAKAFAAAIAMHRHWDRDPHAVSA
jgi:catalase